MLKKLLPRSQFSQNVIILMTGTGLAQLLPIIAAPIITRIYTPAEFGVFAFYFSLVSILSVIATGRYEIAILVPDKEENAFQLAILSIGTCLIVSTTLFLGLFFFGKELSELFGRKGAIKEIYYIPFSIFLLGAYQSFYYWLNRKKNFKAMAISRVIQSSTMVIIQIFLGVFTTIGASGLVLGYIFGQLFATTTIAKQFYGGWEYKITSEKQYKIAKRYSAFPKFLLIAHSLNTASGQLPSLVFTTLFSSIAAGYYMLIQRVVGAPLSIAASAIGDVFRQEASEALATRGECISEYKNAFKKLVIISFMPFFLFILIAPQLFEFVFGEEWKVAGKYAQALTPMFFMQFITSPLSSLFMLAEKQKMDLLWQIALFLVTATAMFLGYLHSSIYLSLILFSIAYSIMYAVNGIMTWRFAHGNKVPAIGYRA